MNQDTLWSLLAIGLLVIVTVISKNGWWSNIGSLFSGITAPDWFKKYWWVPIVVVAAAVAFWQIYIHMISRGGADPRTAKGLLSVVATAIVWGLAGSLPSGTKPARWTTILVGGLITFVLVRDPIPYFRADSTGATVANFSADPITGMLSFGPNHLEFHPETGDKLEYTSSTTEAKSLLQKLNKLPKKMGGRFTEESVVEDSLHAEPGEKSRKSVVPAHFVPGGALFHSLAYPREAFGRAKIWTGWDKEEILGPETDLSGGPNVPPENLWVQIESIDDRPVTATVVWVAKNLD